MRRSMSVAALLAVAILVLSQSAQAQTTCREFKAMSQWATGEQGFHGPIYALVDEASFIAPDAYWTEIPNETCNAGTCSGRGGKLPIDFGNGNSLVLTLQHGTYTPDYNTIPEFGVWRGTMSVVEGQGLFRDATGVFAFDGPWTIWIDETGFHGVFNGTFTGSVCIRSK